ncbi:hypothetical protein SAMN05660666_00860 [Novosphingobium aromaticivorans]|nr:hypothetical protein SAMN05660666_00860 [Novosphingobium aromaticivorans]
MSPSFHTRQGKLAVLVGLAALIMSGCSSNVPGEDQAAPSDAASENVSEVAPGQPTEATRLAPIGRIDLIAAFGRASDAVAAGQALPDANRQLVGRTFSLKLPFGCDGEADKERPAWAGWTLDRNRQALKLSAAPERWTDAAWAKSIAGDMAHEAVEGFWIERPWTSSEECPAGNPASESGLPASDERQTMGIAQFFAPDSPRTFQRGSRPYAHTIRVREPADVEGRTYRFAVSGRVTGFPDGQPIHCVQDAPDRRPVCLMAVELARVSFEDPRDGTVLVEWRN